MKQVQTEVAGSTPAERTIFVSGYSVAACGKNWVEALKKSGKFMSAQIRAYSPKTLLGRIQSEEEFNAERNRVSHREAISRKLLTFALVSAVLVFLILVTGPQVLADVVLVALVLPLVLAFVVPLFHEYYAEVRAACTPLAGTSDCLKAARLIDDFTKAREIRDAALAQNRQLYYADLHAMEDATRGLSPEYSDEHLREVCAQAHGASSLPIQQA